CVRTIQMCGWGTGSGRSPLAADRVAGERGREQDEPMMASAAVLSDIHGVLPALDAVLAEPDVAAAGRIVLTGDIAAGPQPVEVLDRLLGLGDRVIWVRGNADRELVALARGDDVDVPDPISHWAAGQLSADHLDWLARLPHPVTLEV